MVHGLFNSVTSCFKVAKSSLDNLSSQSMTVSQTHFRSKLKSIVHGARTPTGSQTLVTDANNSSFSWVLYVCQIQDNHRKKLYHISSTFSLSADAV